MTARPPAPIKLGLHNANLGVNVRREHTANTVTLAERLGLESLWAADHPAVPARTASDFPYAATGEIPLALTTSDFPDPLIWLAHAAAITRHITLATGVLLAALRDPIVTAKQIASVDTLSNGRVVLGVGVGWLAEKYTALGVDFGSRAGRLESNLQAMRTLWSDDVASMHDDHVEFTGVVSLPKPVRRSLPVVIGGSAPAAARRAARMGDGYFPGGDLDDPQLRHRFDTIRRECDIIGRDAASIEFTVYSD